MEAKGPFSIINTMVADDLATLGTGTSAAMVLTLLSQNIPVSVPEGLNNRPG